MNIENQNKSKKAFDPTNNFTFFGSWLKSMECLETESDRSSNAYQLFKAIAYYSMYDEEPNFEGELLLNALWELIEREIDISVSNRKRNFANDEANEKYQTIINAIVSNPSLSVRTIADMTGTDKSMVYRVKRKYARAIEESIKSNDTGSNAINDVDIVNGNSNGTYRDTVNDTMRQDSETGEHTVSIDEEKESLEEWLSENDNGLNDDDMPF